MRRSIWRFHLDKETYFEVDPILPCQVHFNLAAIFIHDVELEARTVPNGVIFIDTWL